MKIGKFPNIFFLALCGWNYYWLNVQIVFFGWMTSCLNEYHNSFGPTFKQFQKLKVYWSVMKIEKKCFSVDKEVPHSYIRPTNERIHFVFHWEICFFPMWHIHIGSFSASIGKTHSTATSISHWKCLIKKFLWLQVRFNTRQIQLVERSHFTQHSSSLLHIFKLQTEHKEQSKTITFQRKKETDERHSGPKKQRI